MPFNLENHIISHGPCFDVQGTVPATIAPHPGSRIKATVSFLNMDQQEALTKTKFDYDLLLLKNPVNVSPNSPAVRTLLHANVWGALSDDRANPLARIENKFSQITNLKKISALQAMQRVAGCLGNSDEYPIAGRMTDKERLTNNAIIQSKVGIPTQFPEATWIKFADVRKVAEDLILPISPV